MYLGAENTSLNAYQSYLVDALRFALSVSPNSIPCDTSIGIEMPKVSDFEDITKYKVRKLLSVLDPSGSLECTACSLDKDTVNIIVRFRSSGDTYRVSLN